MNIVGKWKFDSIMSFSELGDVKFSSADEYLNMPYDFEDEDEIVYEKRERLQLVNSIVDVSADGKLFILMPLPEGVSQEDIDAEVAKDRIKLRDGYMIRDEYEWEDRDGVIYYNTTINGEMFGEAMDSWTKLFDEDGKMMLITIKYVQA